MKFVVVAEKKYPGGSQVMCLAQSREECEACQRRLEANEQTKYYGPFSIIPHGEAEKRKLYGC
jgi:hypothetical protein